MATALYRAVRIGFGTRKNERIIYYSECQIDSQRKWKRVNVNRFFKQNPVLGLFFLLLCQQNHHKIVKQFKYGMFPSVCEISTTQTKNKWSNSQLLLDAKESYLLAVRNSSSIQSFRINSKSIVLEFWVFPSLILPPNYTSKQWTTQPSQYRCVTFSFAEVAGQTIEKAKNIEFLYRFMSLVCWFFK